MSRKFDQPGGRFAVSTVRCATAAATSEQLQNEVLAPYLANARWFAGKAKVSRRSELMVPGELTTDHGCWLLTVIVVITDFEGEPARTLAERGRKHSPLRDVAGMLRSLSYVAAVAANHATLGRPADRRSLGALGCRWERQASQAFLQAYREAIAECPAWPAAPGAADRLIEFFVVEKALYELRYEMNNRPEWLSIPLHSLLRQLGGEPGQEGAR